MYSEGGKLDSNPTYQCWSKLKDLCAQHPASVSQARVLSTSLASVDDLVEPAINEDLPDVLELMDLSFIQLVHTEVGVGSKTVVSDQQLEEQSVCSVINKSCEIIRQEQPSDSESV